DGVRTLNRAPRVMLGYAELSLLGRVPPDRGRIKQHARALQCCQSSALGIPLIPADQGPKSSSTGIKRAESKIPRSELKTFVIERIVRNVNLPIKAAQRTVFLEPRCSIVVDAGGPFFEQRCDQNDAILPSRRREPFTAGAGDRFCKIKESVILSLTKILCL